MLAPDEVISSEKFQALADVCIAARWKLAIHPSHPPMPVAELNQDNSLDSAAVELVRGARTIFVYADFIDVFFSRIVPLLTRPFFLITNGSTTEIGERFLPQLSTPLLSRWFTINATIAHPKLVVLPLGIANSHHAHGNANLLADVASRGTAKRDGLYVNFEIGTNAAERLPVLKSLQKNPYAVMGRKRPFGISPREMLRRLAGRRPVIPSGKPLPFREYLEAVAQWKYCVSPPGLGVDCHRTWEALYLGAVPVLTRAPLGVLDELPHVFVKHFDGVDGPTLDRRFAELDRPFDMERLRFSYWRNRIRELSV
jgi:hypothetical protein